MSRALSLEDYLADEFRFLGVVPYITHLRLPADCYYCVVTVAASASIPYSDLMADLAVVFSAAERLRIRGSNLDRFLVKRLSEDFGYGVAPCHQGDQFNRWIGRVMSEGRLLKFERRLR